MTTTREELTKGMVAFYDDLARHDAVWGEYLHHGYYEPGELAHVSTNQAAEQRMVDEVLRFAGHSDDPMKKPKNIIDVGCGFGGATVYLAKKYEANCTGINLSTAQIQKSKDLAAANGIGDKFISELARIAAPGATIILTSCCHRDLSPDEKSLKTDERNLLDKIRKTFYQSSHISPSDTVEIVQSLALQDIKVADFSENVVPYFRALVQSQRTWQGLASMLLNGWTNFKVSQNWPLMLKAYENNATKYAVIACRKPK